MRGGGGLLQGEASTSMLPGGVSVSACLADFSLYIFHPYGGGQKKTTLTSLENAFRRTLSECAVFTIARLLAITMPITFTAFRSNSLYNYAKYIAVNIGSCFALQLYEASVASETKTD